MKVKFLKLVVLIFCLFLFAGCMPTGDDGQVSLSVENANIEILIGDLKSITPTVIGAKSGLFYISSDESVFTVTNGIIIGVSEGEAILTIGVKDTSVKASVNVKVVAALSDDINDDIIDDVEDSYTIAGGDEILEVGEEVYLQVLKNDDFYEGTVKWISNNDSVASVDEYGTLRGISEGDAKIVAIVNGNGLSINVNVKNTTIVTVLPTSLKINGNSFVNVNAATFLTVTPNQGSVNSNDLMWFSSDEAIATVNESGLVRGVSAGVVTITAEIADIEVSNTFTLLIKDAGTSASPITSISITGEKEVLSGNRIKLSVSYTPADEVASFSYSSSNELVAIVDAAGWVTGVSGGSVQITAALNGDISKTSTFSITVIPVTEGLTIIGASKVSYNQNIILSAQAYPVGSNSTVTWSSSNPGVATVDANGRVTGMALGIATITATSIVPGVTPITHIVTVIDEISITLNPTVLSLPISGTKTITAVVNASSLSDKSIIWTSSNTSVATVSTAGLITAKAAGSATIVAKLNADASVQAQVSLTVTAVLKPTITISAASASLMAGATKALTATVSNSTNTAVTWTTSSANVATVANGTVTAKAAGTATITATSVADASVKATCVVTVTAPPAGVLVVTQNPTGSIKVGATGYQLYVDNTAGSVSRLECTFVSANAAIATVSAYGTVSALKDGTVKITVNHPTKGTGSITLTIGGGTTPPVTPPTTKVLTVTADPNATIKVGAANYQIYVRDSSGVSVSRTECTFTSSASTVATVSAYGTISALKAGSAKITATHPSKGTGTITLTITGTTVTPPTGPVTGLVGAYNQGTVRASNNLGYGVVHTRYNGTSRYSSNTSYVSQRVSVLSVTPKGGAKVVMWTKFASASSWQYNTIANLIASYEASNKTMKVLAAANADYYDIWPRGALPYQTMGTLVVAGNTYKSTVTKTNNFVDPGSDAGYKTLGFPNNGSANSIISGTPTRALKLKVCNSSGSLIQTFDVNTTNANPGAGGISLFYALYNANHAAVAKAVTKPASGKLMVVGTGARVLANSNRDFYGNGKLTSANAASASLKANQFAISSNNATLNALVANTNHIFRVEYVFSGAFAGIRDATNATRGFILDNKAVSAATCIASRTDIGQRHPRTMIGKKADGTIILVAADGRQTGMSGVRVEEMQAIMAKYGCVDAFSFDGGGSTRMMIRSGSSFITANAASENRSVTTAILVVAPR